MDAEGDGREKGEGDLSLVFVLHLLD